MRLGKRTENKDNEQKDNENSEFHHHLCPTTLVLHFIFKPERRTLIFPFLVQLSIFCRFESGPISHGLSDAGFEARAFAASKFRQQNATVLAYLCSKLGWSTSYRRTKTQAMLLPKIFCHAFITSQGELPYMPVSKGRSKRCMLLPGLAALLFILVSAAIAQQAPVSSMDANMVGVLVTVRDKHGKVIDNLSQSDFVVEEEGSKQAIRFFSRGVDLPLTLGLLVDTSLDQRQALEQERSGSVHFVDQVLREDKDKAFLIHFDREVELLQDLTPSKQKLDAALGSLPQPQLKRSDDDTSSGGSGNPRGGRRAGHGELGGALYDSVYLAANELMLKQQGRKAVIVLSSGVDRGSKVTLERAIEAAQRANTVVYSILSTAKQSSDTGGGWVGGGGGGGGWGGPMGRRGGGYPRAPRSQPERGYGKDILERISKETGGRMFEVSKKETVDQIYQTIQEELRNQYDLGYVPSRLDNASDYRKISVTTKQKELVVQARAGYYPAQQLDAKQEKEQK
jgi:VWFA-related protein